MLLRVNVCLAQERFGRWWCSGSRPSRRRPTYSEVSQLVMQSRRWSGRDVILFIYLIYRIMYNRSLSPGRMKYIRGPQVADQVHVSIGLFHDRKYNLKIIYNFMYCFNEQKRYTFFRGTSPCPDPPRVPFFSFKRTHPKITHATA